MASKMPCSAAVLPGDRSSLVTGGYSQGGAIQTTAVLDLGTMVFAPGPAMAFPRFGCVVVVLPGGSRALVVGGHSAAPYVSSTKLLGLGTMAF